MTAIISAHGLTKRYGPQRVAGQGLLAVDHIDFEVRQGEIFGFSLDEFVVAPAGYSFAAVNTPSAAPRARSS